MLTCCQDNSQELVFSFYFWVLRITQFVRVVSKHLYLPGLLPLPMSSLFFLFVCLFIETGSHCKDLAETHYVDQDGFKLRDPPLSASASVGLKECIIIPGFVVVDNHIVHAFTRASDVNNDVLWSLNQDFFLTRLGIETKLLCILCKVL